MPREKLSKLSINFTVESDENYDFVQIDARIDDKISISKPEQWCLLNAVEIEVRAFLSGLSQQRYLTQDQHRFLARMNAEEFAIAAKSWDYDSKEWSFEKHCALSKNISWCAFFGTPIGPEPFMGAMQDYILIDPLTKIGKLIFRERKSVSFQEFFLDSDEYIATWQEAVDKLGQRCRTRQKSAPDH